MNQLKENKLINSSRKNLYLVAGGAALVTGLLLLSAAIDLVVDFQPNATSGVLAIFRNNWLIVIFKLHAGYSGVQIDQLHVLNQLDIVILALVAIMFIGLCAVLWKTSKIWSIIALVQPFLGIVLFIATKSAGRSAVMGAALVISIVMLKNNSFNKVSAAMGILASILLLVGDFSVGVIPSSPIMAVLFGIGYVFLIIWLFLITRRLFEAP